nr:hypothetical protein [Tanacetum cinerariifolium]
MTLPSWSDAKIVEESHHLCFQLLEHVPSHNTAPASEGAIISFLPHEIAASQPDSHLAKKSKGLSQASPPSKKRKLHKRASKAGSSSPELDQAEGADEADLANLCAEIEDSLERDEGVSMRVVLALTPCLDKRLGAPPSTTIVSVSEPSNVGTSTPAFTFGRSLFLGVVELGSPGLRLCGVKWINWSLARSALARDPEYDQIPNDDFGTTTRGEEIGLTLFPLAPGPYHMPYPYEGVSSPLYTREEWNGPHAPKSNILEEVSQFVGSGVEGVVQKLLSSDEYHAALARVASLGINYSAERGLRIGRIDIEFEAAVQKVSNFHVGAKADFNKALVDFPATSFLFLAKLLRRLETWQRCILKQSISQLFPS